MTGAPRLLPLMAFAALCLAALKLAGLVLGGGYVLTGIAPATAQKAAAAPETTAATPAPGNAVALPQPERAEPAAETIVNGPRVAPTRTEMDVLESLAQRRKALEQHERELKLRENLLRAAEVKVEARIGELKAIEGRIDKELKEQDDARKAQHGRLVQMYANMKPRDAAKILNRMDFDVLNLLVAEMSPRVMSAILAEMEPAVAQRLTLEIANKNKALPAEANDLPKIQGRGPS